MPVSAGPWGVTRVIKNNKIKRKKISSSYSKSPESEDVINHWFLYWKYIEYAYDILFKLKFKILLNIHCTVPKKQLMLAKF